MCLGSARQQTSGQGGLWTPGRTVQLSELVLVTLGRNPAGHPRLIQQETLKEPRPQVMNPGTPGSRAPGRCGPGHRSTADNSGTGDADGHSSAPLGLSHPGRWALTPGHRPWPWAGQDSDHCLSCRSHHQKMALSSTDSDTSPARALHLPALSGPRPPGAWHGPAPVTSTQGRCFWRLSTSPGSCAHAI